MRVVLLNPPWHYEGSIYFGCREPHLPLELGYARALLQEEGHEAILIDAHAAPAVDWAAAIAALAPDLLVLTTAPTYLFWRCPPPELRVPMEALAALRAVDCPKVAVGPHPSTSPATTLRKLGVDAVVLGECEETIAALARTPLADWASLPSVLVTAAAEAGAVSAPPRSASCDMSRLPPLLWRDDEVARHVHHHHRFDGGASGLGAEIEASRGCPFACTFCAKTTHRDRYRRRPNDIVAVELDSLIRQGVGYVYFIDEIFLPDERLLELLLGRDIQFGIQTRIDLWSEAQLELLGRAGCVSIEAGIESVSVEGRQALDKRCRLDTAALTGRLVHAKHFVPFVQATLMESRHDDPAELARWREEWIRAGLWVNDPVPLFPYPGSPDYTRLWGAPDEHAWERAHDHYLGRFSTLSDLQERRPLRLRVLEGTG
jgi:B12-binding domain/radical SAM domain protein of rhizo-twelve system